MSLYHLDPLLEVKILNSYTSHSLKHRRLNKYMQLHFQLKEDLNFEEICSQHCYYRACIAVRYLIDLQNKFLMQDRPNLMSSMFLINMKKMDKIYFVNRYNSCISRMQKFNFTTIFAVILIIIQSQKVTNLHQQMKEAQQ